MARQASGAVFVDVGPNLNFFRKELQAKFKAMKPFQVPVQGKWGGFVKTFDADVRAAGRKREFTVPVKASFGGFDKSFKQDLRAAWKMYSKKLSVPLKVGVDKQVTPALKETREQIRRTADDTDTLSGKFKAFGLLTGLAAPMVIAFAAAFPGAVLVVTNLTVALVPLVGYLAALPAFLLAATVGISVYKMATAGFGDAIGALMKGDAKKWDEYLQKLAPNARRAAQAIATMKPQLKGLQQAVQQKFFAGFAEDLRLTGQKYLPLLRSQLPPVAASMSGFVENFAAGTREATGFRGVRDIITATGTSLARANDNMRPFTASILSMGTAGAPAVLRLGNAFANGTGKLSAFIARSVQSGAASRWIDDAIDTSKTLGGVLGNVGSIMYSIFSAGNTQGGGLLTTWKDLTGEAAAFLRTTQGAQGLVAFFSGLSAIKSGVGDVAGAVVPALAQAFIILAPALQDAAPALAELAIAAVPLVPALATLAAGVLPPLVDVLQVLIVPLTWVATGLGIIFGWMGKNTLVSAFVATIITGIIAFKLFVGVMKVIAFVTKAWAVAQWILNAAWAANPVGVIIIGIIALAAALVLAYKRSETFRNIVHGVFRAVATAGKWMWNSVLKPAFAGTVNAVKAVGAAAVWLWKNAIRPAWDGIATASRWLWNSVIKPVWGFISGYFKVWWTVVKAIFTAVVWYLSNFIIPWYVRLGEIIVMALKGAGSAIRWWWNNVTMPIFNAVVWYITNVLVPVFTWLWKNIIKPTFEGISAAIRWWWNNVTMPVFNAVKWYITNVLVPGFTWLWNVAKTVWNGIGSVISVVWRTTIKPAFDFLKDAVMTKLPAAFRIGRDAVGKAWGEIKNLAKVPIKFIIETVINDGIIGAYNWVAKKFGVKPASKVPLPRGFAAGGVVPGYRPGVDNVPAILSPGEGILRPEVVRALGPEMIHEWNRSARDGRLAGFAKGGIVGREPRTGGPLDFLKGIGDMVLDPVAAFRKKLGLDGLLEKLGNTDFARLVAKVPNKIVDVVVEKVKGFFDATGGPSPNLNGPGGSSIRMIASIAKMFNPAASVSSGYRRGDPGWHGKGLAADLVGGGAGGMRKIAAGFYQLAPYLLEEIHTPGRYFVKNGRRADVYNGAIKADHYDHVHVAATTAALRSIQQYDDGGVLKPGRTLTYNGTGRPEAVLTEKQWRIMAANKKNGGDKHYQFNIKNPKDKPTPKTIMDTLRRNELVYGDD